MRSGDTHSLPPSVGKYRVDGVLGRGAMGVVYRAYDAAIDRVVALKTIRTDLLSSDDAAQWRERFRREARAAARCLHPNIVTVFEYGEAGEIAFIAMEHVAGRQLLDFLTGPRLLDRKLALSVVTQMLLALDYAHARGIVHRDIKPANVLLLEDGQVKVADFGVARIETTGDLTQHGAMVGTPRYMSPEQFTGDPIDRRSDLFSVGIILFELLTGEKPFPGRTTTEVMYHVLHDPPRDPRSLNPEVPAALSAVIRRALARRPEDRFQTAAEFSAALMPVAAAPFGQTVEPPDSAATVYIPAGSAPPADIGARVAGLEADLLRRIEEVLAFHVGPVAKVLVRKAAAGSASLDELTRALATNLPTETEQAEFLKKVKRAIGGQSGSGTTAGSLAGSRLTSASRLLGTGLSGTSGTMGSGPSVLSDMELDKARQDLTVTLGPIAAVLVRKLSRRATSLGELYRLLAEHIPGEGDRATFLRKAPPL